MVVQVARLQDGSRKIVSIAEVLGAADDRVQMQEVFAFERLGVSDAGKVQGRFHGAGTVPRIMDRLRISGLSLPASVFEETLSVNI
jgi:pilus assembly protein CpaF